MKNTEKTNSTGKRREVGVRTFLAILAVMTAVYGSVLAYHLRHPQELSANVGTLEYCRQVCLGYGLLPSGNIRTDAEDYLRAVGFKGQDQDTAQVVAPRDTELPAGQLFPLLDQPAPDFMLSDDQGAQVRLSDLVRKRPLVIVFYLGYGCSHCVAQLFALDKDRHSFQELDADIVAISSDTPEHTAERFREYGRFGFPVLADTDYAVSTQWGVYTPATEEKAEFMLHGTFIVDRNGKVIWGETGREPFLDNKTLLSVIAKSQGSLPEATSAETASGATSATTVRN